MPILYRFILALAMVFGGGHLSSQESVKIYYKKIILTEGIKYEYSVINGTSKSIWGILVGGVQSKWDIPHSLFVDPKQIFSPPEWESIIEPMEESNNFAVRWKNFEQNNMIRPGETKAGFGVLLPKDDPEYAKGPFEVRFSEGKGFLGNIMPAPEGFAFVSSQKARPPAKGKNKVPR